MDRDDLLAAMYADEPETPKTPVEPHGGRTRTIRVGAIHYEVPTPDYLHQLEQRVIQQADTIEHLRRSLTRVTTMLYGTRNFVRRQTETIAATRLTRVSDL